MKQEIKNIIAEKCAVPIDSVNGDTPLSEIAQDSLSRIDFLFEIEEAIGKKIPEDKILEIETVGDLLEIIEKL